MSTKINESLYVLSAIKLNKKDYERLMAKPMRDKNLTKSQWIKFALENANDFYNLNVNLKSINSNIEAIKTEIDASNNIRNILGAK